MNNIILYGHGGSGNHGCEAIIRSMHKIIGTVNSTLMSSNAAEDNRYNIDKISTIKSANKVHSKLTWDFLIAYLKLKLQKQYIHIDLLPYQDAIKKRTDKFDIALSIGGDNYCYGDITIYEYLNQLYNRQNIKTAFIGCSVEPNSIKQSNMLADLQRYSLIIARESLTYEAMINAGLTHVTLLPDPAFVLDRIDLPLPQHFIKDNTIGINISHVVIEGANQSGTTIKNYEHLIEHIIATTDMQIALIPHVVWEGKDDRVPLRMLFEKYKHTGRVVMIEDHNCMELKGYIARCRFMIAARTHASIAAYSTCVPTLVVGYSVKAKGIAKDIFGTHENYVLPVQSLTRENDLTNAFDWIYKNEDQIRKHLQAIMPEYRDRALLIGEELKKIM
ncbi:MAG: polysaccharide pyruvyl transferase family protein [Rikenellaceae bacterium]|nr:polysaccharide pyruvyl transferase family protein [Rikenellaceae bacterium]